MKKTLLLTLTLVAISLVTFAQSGSINTFAVYANNNGSSAISFEIESTVPIEITGISNTYNTGSINAEVWIKPGGITTTSSPLAVTTANGWSLYQTIPITGLGGTNVTQLTGLNPIQVNPGTPVGIVITGSMGYHGTNTNPPNPTTFVDGPVTLRTGGTKGYGGAVPNLSNNPRAFIGIVDYQVLSFAPEDAGVTSIDSPAVFCPGIEDVYATVANFGRDTLTSVDVTWSVDGVVQSTIPLTLSLDTIGGAGQTDTTVLLGSWNFMSGIPYDIEVWTSNPNGVADTINLNDTAYATLQGALTGNFTIGASGADYTNFSSAAAALSNFGVCGPVHFDVDPGTYNDFFELTEISGTSSVNTITFDGGDRSLVNITHDGSSQNATVWLNGADWVTVKNITVNSTSTSSDSWGILFSNEANHNTIDSCDIILPIATTDDRCGILASSSPANDFGEGNNANFTTISNCNIVGGDRNITFEGAGTGNWTVGNRFINNTLRFADDYGFYGDDQDSLVFQGNTISDLQNAANADGFYCFDFENLTLRENIIEANDWAVYCSDLNVDNIGGRSIIANNYVVSNNDYGIRLLDAENVDIWHNTAFGEPALQLDYSFDGLDSIDVRNNIFISNADYAFEIDLNVGFVGVSALDNNIYNTNGTNFAFWEGQQFTDLASWQTTFPQYNINSFEGDPIFFAPGDFHVVGPLANNQGSPTPIDIDLDGDPRSASTPDIGADEYSLLPDDAGVLSIDSPGVFCPGTFPVWATITNFGTNQILTATVDWTIDGVPQPQGSFSGLLDTLGGTGSRDGLIQLGTFNFSTNNPYLVKAWISSANGNPDPNPTNDTLEVVIQSNLPPPTNLAVQSITSNSATLTWTGGSANTWLYENVPSGVPLTGSGIPTSVATATVGSLMPTTAYDFYVREVCASGDTSAWAGPFTYQTPFFCPPGAYCFSTGGQTGRSGPSQTQINTAYAASNLAGQVDVVNGVQYWVVPGTGAYSIQTIGASGGGVSGGLGANVSGEFILNGGDTLMIMVGQEGTDPGDGSATGGGGTFVVLIDPSSGTTTSTGTPVSPLIIAGGGGANPGVQNNDCNASLMQNGNNGDGANGSGIGGTAGNGGGISVPSGNNRGGGGGGFLTDGERTGTCGTGGQESGAGFVNGGVGGLSVGCSTPHEGGFGGGGGSISSGWRGSGGGGGYSGGGAGQTNTNATTHRGGGGGSFNSGTNTAGSLAAFGPGRVIIQSLSSGSLNDIGVASIDSPNVYCPGTIDVYATILNFGINQVTTATVNWAVDGASQPSVNFTGLLDTLGGTGSSSAQVNLGSFAFSTNNPYDITVWTTLPNGQTDTVTFNDSLTRTVQSSLPPPVGLMVNTVAGTSATISWNPGSLANSWLWTVVPFGSAPTGVGNAVSTPTASVTGLTPETFYDFYVREVCPTGDTSTWAGPLTFETPFFCPPNAFCFLTGGATGQNGPTQSDLTAAYAGTTLQGLVTSNNGTQAWTVPTSGLYKITAYGAQGGGSDTRPGGRGAMAQGEFILNAGTTMNVVVGQTGLISTGTTPAGNRGGGGGSFVWDASQTSQPPLIAAGGGGGTNVSVTSAAPGVGGSDLPDGTLRGDGNGSPGTNGNGAAAGGAGFFTGSTGSNSGNEATAIIAGAQGGDGYTATSHYGGFGGGGGGGGSPSTTFASGGGGGYSGGAGQGTPASQGGGGGGSYVGGLNAMIMADNRFDNGVVIIESLSSGATNDVGIAGVTPNSTLQCSGDYDIVATVLNYGANQVNSLDVSWSWNGVNQGTIPITTPLDTSGGSGVNTVDVFLGTRTFVGSNSLSVWTSAPNGVLDTVSSNDTLENIINPQFVSAEIITSSGAETCGPGTVTLNATFTGDSLNWYDDPGLTNLVNSGTSYTISITTTETYYLRAENVNGCDSEVDTLLAEVNFTPTVNFSNSASPSTSCTQLFTSTLSNNVDSVRWFFGDGNTSDSLNPVHTYNQGPQTFVVQLIAYDGTCSDSVSRGVFVNCNVGFSDSDLSSNINVYPNPSNGEFQIEIDGPRFHTIEILDIKGNLIYTEEGQFNENKRVELGNISSGKYILRMSGDDGTAVKNLVIE